MAVDVSEALLFPSTGNGRRTQSDERELRALGVASSPPLPLPVALLITACWCTPCLETARFTNPGERMDYGFFFLFLFLFIYFGFWNRFLVLRNSLYGRGTDKVNLGGLGILDVEA